MNQNTEDVFKQQKERKNMIKNKENNKINRKEYLKRLIIIVGILIVNALGFINSVYAVNNKTGHQKTLRGKQRKNTL